MAKKTKRKPQEKLVNPVIKFAIYKRDGKHKFALQAGPLSDEGPLIKVHDLTRSELVATVPAYMQTAQNGQSVWMVDVGGKQIEVAYLVYHVFDIECDREGGVSWPDTSVDR